MFTAELKTEIKLSQNRSVSASVSENVNAKSGIQMSEMHNALEEMVKPYLTDGCEFKATYSERPVRREGRMISDKQIGYLKKLFRETGTPEEAFCRKYSVRRINDMPMEMARTAIQDLKTANLFDE